MASKILKSTNEYQKHVACSYCYKLIYVDSKFRKSFKSYLYDAVYNFINRMMKESKYRTIIMKKHFNKKNCDN